MKIGIMVPFLIEGDAIGNDVMGMYASLKKHGHDPVLYAPQAHIPLPVVPVGGLPRGNLDMLIFHHGIGWEVGVRAFAAARCHRILKWHNITPPHFFEDQPVVKRCSQAGWDQLPLLLNRSSEVWADSEFNGLELQRFKKVPFKVIPPFNQADLLMRITADVKSAAHFDDSKTNVIMVGRIAQNKDHLTAIEGFAKYCAGNKSSRLIIVGSTSCADYAQKVMRRIGELGLSNVVVTGKVPIETLKALYMVSDVLLLTSRHEGFCVPMVEAMALGIPVVSNDQCALPYTGKDAVYYARSADEIAAGIANVIANRSFYVEKGRNLSRSYQTSSIEPQLITAVSSIFARGLTAFESNLYVDSAPERTISRLSRKFYSGYQRFVRPFMPRRLDGWVAKAKSWYLRKVG